MESVHEGDQYQYLGRFKEPLHIRSSNPNRRQMPLVAVYVLGMFKGGMVKCFSWTLEEVIAHRDAHVQNWKTEVTFAKKDGRPTDENNLWHERNPAFPVMAMKSVMRHAINRGEFPISVKDMRLLAQEDEPIEGHVVPGQGITQEEAASLAFDSPAGYSETLHQEPVAGYVVESPGDENAADARRELADHICTGDPPRLGPNDNLPPTLRPDADGAPVPGMLPAWLRDLANCKTEEAVDQLVSDALNGPDGIDIRQQGEEKKAAMTFLQRERAASRKK
jgi:hypothetical protein